MTGTSKMTLSIPRDCAGTFDPKLIARYQSRFPDFDAKIVSTLRARHERARDLRPSGETLRHRRLAGPDLGLTDAVLEQVAEWQNRPLEIAICSSSSRSGSRSGTKDSFATRRSEAAGRAHHQRFPGDVAIEVSQILDQAVDLADVAGDSGPLISFGLMAKLDRLEPNDGAGASLHRHDTCRLALHKPAKLQARQLLAKYDSSVSPRSMQLVG
ncbi:transposase [Mesorhizobium sp. M0088]|uniref:transposase n=1 Tax=Mesorhizobium sp. M0088 TaxID=2956873 RepID=UPI003339A7B4